MYTPSLEGWQVIFELAEYHKNQYKPNLFQQSLSIV